MQLVRQFKKNWSNILPGENIAHAAMKHTVVYEIRPKSIGPTFISPRHSVRATPAGHERQQ